MGIFGKLFDKKNCDICGGDIGLLGNKKLEDGNLCKECAAKLSPWFSERKSSTVEEIRQQLEYRENNREVLRNFHTTRCVGRNTKVYIDEDAGKFFVCSSSNLEAANPDVLDLSQITNCDMNIEENHHEEKHAEKGPDGTTRQVSYNPPHYKYNYNFKIRISVNHPYFNEMSFNVNPSSVTIDTIGLLGQNVVYQETVRQPVGRPGAPAARPAAPGIRQNAAGTINQGHQAMASAKSGAARPGMPQRPAAPGARPAGVGNAVGNAVRSAVTSTVRYSQGSADPRQTNTNYTEYERMGREIVELLSGLREEAREEAAPQMAVLCPFCGASTIPDASGCCEYCGGALGS